MIKRKLLLLGVVVSILSIGSFSSAFSVRDTLKSIPANGTLSFSAGDCFRVRNNTDSFDFYTSDGTFLLSRKNDSSGDLGKIICFNVDGYVSSSRSSNTQTNFWSFAGTPFQCSNCESCLFSGSVSDLSVEPYFLISPDYSKGDFSLGSDSCARFKGLIYDSSNNLLADTSSFGTYEYFCSDVPFHFTSSSNLVSFSFAGTPFDCEDCGLFEDEDNCNLVHNVLGSLKDSINEFIPIISYVGIGIISALLGFFAIRYLINWVRNNTLSVFKSRKKR